MLSVLNKCGHANRDSTYTEAKTFKVKKKTI